MSKQNKLNLLVVNDNGNSEQAIKINGKLIRQPNVYSVPTKKGFVRDIAAESLIPTLVDEIYVTISSPSIRRNQEYYIGNKAIKSEFKPRNMNVNVETKYTSDLPIINTTGTIAVYAVQEYFQKNNTIPNNLNVEVDMFTALPIEQWTPENADRLAKRFQQVHTVTVHINEVSVVVNMTFDIVKVAPEGTPALFYLIYNDKREFRGKNDKMYSYYNQHYKTEITGEKLSNLRISHIDIGDGTTDFPITTGFNFNNDIVEGTKNGAGHAIQDALDEFKKRNPIIKKLTRQKFSEYLKDEDHQYHQEAYDLVEKSLINEADFIYDEYLEVLSKVDNEIDVIAVYGGGSILMKEALEPLLKELADNLGKELLWVPAEYAALMNVEGLQVLAENVHKQLKKESEKAEVKS